MMKIKELKNKIIEKLKETNDKHNKNKANKTQPFNSLSPINNAENCDVYLESLEWALANKHKNRNIAVSGSYGSGKSSIIQTFIKKTQSSENFWRKIFPKYRFFNISLATFKETTEVIPDNNYYTELQRLIELSILQQLFFHEKDINIPDSRFKKIKRHKRFKLFSYTIGIIAFLISFLFLLTPEFIAKFSILNFNSKYLNILNKTTSSITLLGIFIIIYKFSRSIIGLSIKKMNINNTEIEIEDGISKSILNNHLDEIIYFFEATKYNVVVIEDLDRFAQAEIFTKLREINILINNSKKIKRDIVFIYAIKDDMFLDKNRAKFFDFIIPIIPVLNFSNSGAKLREIAKKNGYKLNDELLDDLSMFIDDMRLLYNIMNELYIYSKMISNNLDINRLLSIIVYKNIYPNDFTKLNKNQGDLFETISKKRDYIKSSIIELDNKITTLKNEIKKIEEQNLSDLKELRIIYLAKIIEIINNGFVGFLGNYSKISISDSTSDEHFQKVKTGKIDYYYYRQSYNDIQLTSININFSEIENEVNKDISYSEREKLILDKKRVSKIKIEIEKISELKNQVKKIKLKDLLINKQIIIDTDTNNKSNIINILLRSGYIDENYIDYISVFHEGALTKSDYLFLINLKTEKGNSFDYKLNKTEEVIKKINEFAFEKDFTLNYDLVDALLQNNNFISKKKILFQQLSNENDKTFTFINEFIDRTANIEKFIFELCEFWPNIWSFIYSKAMLSDDRVEKYFELIIQHADINNITLIFTNDCKYICNYSGFLNIKVEGSKLIDIIKNLNIKFNKIKTNSPEQLLNFVFENNYYSLNKEMIRCYSSINNVFDAEFFQTMNYSFILNTKLQKMITYIDSNIVDYIENTFLKLENNTEEKIDTYSILLNNKDLNIKQKERIIIQTNTIINNIDTITEIDVRNLLLTYSKINPKWNNILVLFEENENILSDEVIKYINNIQNAETLSKIRMTTDTDAQNIPINGKLCRALLNDININNQILELISKSIPWWYESFETNNLSKERVLILIENNKISPTPNSFNYLRDNFKSTNILLLETHYVKFKELINDLIIDSDDLLLILKSKVIDMNSKFSFVNNLEDSIILEKSENIKIISKVLIDSDDYNVKDSLKRKLLINDNLTTNEKITLFNKNKTLLNIDSITDFLISIGNEYELISDTSKKATINNNPLNKKLLKTLVEVDYISSVSEIEKGLRVNHKRQE